MFRPPFKEHLGIFDGINSHTQATKTDQQQETPQSPQPKKHSVTDSCSSTTRCLSLPACYMPQEKPTQKLVLIDEAVPESMRSFFANELDVSRLNIIHEHLWFAGLERPANSLHKQLTLDREIVITERADLHLVWEEGCIYVKPLSDFLLSYKVWESFLCQNQALYEDAAGFLLSYVWLINHRSDLRLAHEHGLIDSSISWEEWTILSASILASIDHESLPYVNIRYRRGELRLHRINWIYRLCSRTRSFTNFTRAYKYHYPGYSSFFKQNVAWLVTAAVYVVLALTAMQVGLVTDQLRDNNAFQRASFGFSVFSIIAPIAVFVSVLSVMIVLVAVNWRFSWKVRKEWPMPALNKYYH